MTKVIITDGGRKDAGYKGTANDCVTRAFAIATGLPYKVAYEEVYRFLSNYVDGGSPRTGLRPDLVGRFFGRMGWSFVDLSLVSRVGGFTIESLPAGKVIALMDDHVCVVVDGIVHDAYDPTLKGKNTVNGYWFKS
jgi:hypothetical protein